MNRVKALLSIMIAAALIVGCGSSADRAERSALAALETPVAKPFTAPDPECESHPVAGPITASLSPPAVMPAPGAMPAGSYMATIRRRGYLIAGVDENTRLLSYWSPLTKTFTGFEIDLLHQLSDAIFGSPDHVHFLAVTTAERIGAVTSGRVDIVVDAMTITPERKGCVDFTTVYYSAKQKLLVPLHSSIKNVHDLAGKWVCATKGSTSATTLLHDAPESKLDGVAQRTDCLVALEDGNVAAITSDNAILLGLESQDAATQIVGSSLAPEPYGMAISKAHPDFVRFVNGWLAEIRANGTLRRLYNHWFKPYTHHTEAPPMASYVP